MKKLLSFFIIAIPMMTFCMKGRLRKAHSAPSLLSTSLQIKGELIPQRPLRCKLLQTKPALALVLLVRGKNLRLDSDVNRKANELYFIACKVNPNKRELLEDTNEFYFIEKISSKKLAKTID